MIRLATALVLGLAALPGLATLACASSAPNPATTGAAPGGGGGSKGPDPALYMPADPHLSLIDLARVQALAPKTDLGNLGYEQVAAIENALIHPALAGQRAALIEASLAPQY